MKKHQNTVFQYAQGGFGSISIDLTTGRVSKRSQKQSDQTLAQELFIYQHLNKKPRCDYIVQQFDAIYADNKLDSLILERCDCDARYYQSHGYMSAEMLDVIALQLLEALTHIHDRGVIHCDIKPSNILMCFDTDGGFIIKLCDFGLSQLAHATQKHTIKGTSGYIDPRVVLDKAPYNHVSDMWAAAITLLMLSGKYNHVKSLQTESLKQLAKNGTKGSKDVIDEFIQLSLPAVLNTNTVVYLAVRALLTSLAPVADTMKDVMEAVQAQAIPCNHLLQAQFNDSKALSAFPMFEYFKIRDNLRIYIVNRLLVITEDKDINPRSIVLSQNAIFYSDHQFVADNKQLLLEYQARFGFPIEHIKMKTIHVPLIENLQVNQDLIQFDFQNHSYSLSIALGTAEVPVQKRFVIKSHNQCKFLVFTPQL